ncbi:MAG: hypothetical protein E6R08_06300 [Nevskiaceae bacterium]|nr:MAG: hypothetical protein E6R08_06300 [Nevskiaceae bacterium]
MNEQAGQLKLALSIPGHAVTDALRDVVAERQRQKLKYDTEEDDAHVLGELGAYAAIYAMPDGCREWDASSTGYGGTLYEALTPHGWRPINKKLSRRDELVRAASLVIAEIERLDRGGLEE